MTVLVSVLGETVTVLGGSVVVPVSVLGGGAVSVTVSVGAPPPPPPPPWCRGARVVVVTGAVVDGTGVVVVVGLGAGDPLASLTTANTSAASRITPKAPAATSAAGRRYHGVPGSGGSGAGSLYPPYRSGAGSLYPPYRAAAVGSE
ncbi:hypothetical protein A5782_00310 [Mycobacterium sp. 852002-40037_SCH5390672]|nr:hypothetical protein [Mycobacterium sp. 852002-40037_SCH5390672]OBC02997.1 hypothetical protein A5782_00310 [Mycobacterium sp. 852002-40037_SCH5390672]